LIASGSATITDQRVVFQSTQQAREFQFSKLLGYQHDPAMPVTFFQVSNRQKVSGITYDTQSARMFRFRLSLALAQYHGEQGGLVAHLRDELAQHDAKRLALPVMMPAQARPAS
jgi:hypothetical protein